MTVAPRIDSLPSEYRDRLDQLPPRSEMDGERREVVVEALGAMASYLASSPKIEHYQVPQIEGMYQFTLIRGAILDLVGRSSGSPITYSELRDKIILEYGDSANPEMIFPVFSEHILGKTVKRNPVTYALGLINPEDKSA